MKTLLSSLLITLVLPGCGLLQSPAAPLKTLPTKPILQVQAQPDGGMCLGPQDTAKLATYIIDLERTILE